MNVNDSNPHAQTMRTTTLIKVVAIALLLAEVLLISTLMDAATIADNRNASLVWILSHAALLIQWSAVAAGAYLLIRIASPEPLPASLQNSQAQSPLILIVKLAINLIAYALFFSLSVQIFKPMATDAGGNLGLATLLWLTCGLTVLLTVLLMILPLRSWWHFGAAQKQALLLCALVATIVTAVSLLSKSLWPTFIYPTFAASEWLLQLFVPAVYSVPEKLYLGVDQFVVHISATCSGVEGMGLAVCFTLLYLYIQRDQLRFPQALILLPLAAVLSWLLNVVRIALLILLGEFVSPDFAIGGFHSQAGWFTFIGLAMAIIYGFNRIPWFKHQSQTAPVAVPLKRDTASAILISFILFLLGALIMGLESRPLNWLYPIKALLGGAALLYFWRTLQIPTPTRLPEAILWGLAGLALWLLLIPTDSGFNQTLSASLGEGALALSIVWVAIRCLGSIVIAPIIEELLFRSYLLARIAGQPIDHRQPLPFHWLSLIVSSLAFGAIHNQWLAGALVGVLFAVARYRGNITSAIIAHATTNAGLCLYAILFGQWSYL
ncbi:exosortase E/protease, VPEID-CTERM system [Halioxenophilus sp. WMMB6]|uniref:exosortase E/protease, VPEID-CTERM system n=1 Tax=Halioxenophilus sp. WMMB6 TaxID=3073815 RepID=UPI00295E9C24|nr:exosortase E/protease, VPEID-CTERM system [Halioxenophilus sp. WMMB6]